MKPNKNLPDELVPAFVLVDGVQIVRDFAIYQNNTKNYIKSKFSAINCNLSVFEKLSNPRLSISNLDRTQQYPRYFSS